MAPASFSAGMSRLICFFSTTDLDCVAARRRAATSSATSSTAARRAPRLCVPRRTLSFTSTLPRASSVPLSSVISCSMAWRLAGSCAAAGLATTSV